MYLFRSYKKSSGAAFIIITINPIDRICEQENNQNRHYIMSISHNEILYLSIYNNVINL